MGISAPVVVKSRELMESHDDAEPEKCPNISVRHHIECSAFSEDGSSVPVGLLHYLSHQCHGEEEPEQLNNLHGVAQGRRWPYMLLERGDINVSQSDLPFWCTIKYGTEGDYHILCARIMR